MFARTKKEDRRFGRIEELKRVADWGEEDERD